MTIGQAYRLLAYVCLVAAVILDPEINTVVWIVFGCAMYAAAEQWKEIEKVKRKVRDETILEMRSEEMSERIKDHDKYITQTTDRVAAAYENALHHLSVFVRDASPTRGK